METTILIDGRQVLAERCLELEPALIGATYTDGVQVYERRGTWFIECQCCRGQQEHHWSPSGHGVDPDGGHYACGPCAGMGYFKIQMP